MEMPTGKLEPAAQAFRAMRLLETVAERMADTYAWPAPFAIEMQSCGSQTPSGFPSARKLALCYELAADFGDLYRGYGDRPSNNEARNRGRAEAVRGGERPRCPPSSAPPAARSSRRPKHRRRVARSARTSGNTCRRAARPGPRLPALAAAHFNSYREYEPGLIGFGTQPTFAIGQRALLLRTAGGNVLWDCISLVDAATVTLISALGGIQAIAISHPHFYTSMVEWSRAFGGVPIHLHAADRAWIMRPDPAIRLWEGETLALRSGVTLIRCGGHFPGGTVLHWAQGRAAAARCAPATSRPSPWTASP